VYLPLLGGDRHRRRPEAPGLTRVRLGLTVAGIILWGYGAHAEVAWLRWTGIGLFAATVVLGFWRGSGRDAGAGDDGTTP
jgi:hypothetical protein